MAVLAALLRLVDTTELTADQFAALCEAAVFYAKTMTAEQAAGLAVEECRRLTTGE